MAAAVQPAELPVSNVYVARQPIFDIHAKIYGYELLYRANMENRFHSADGEEASLSVLSNSAFVFGVDALAGNGKAFVNFTRKALLADYARIFPAKTLVVEVLEGVEVDDHVREACLRLKHDGYLIALDDWDPHGSTGPLLNLADIIKIDFMAFGRKMRQALGADLSRRGITLLAEKVETQDDADQARDFGYTYTQGYFYARPEIRVGTRSSGFKPHRLQLLGVLNSGDPDLDTIEELLRHDPALSFQIISYLNSAAFGLRSRVTTIRQAIFLLGQAGVRTWATVAILADAGSDRPNELIVTSVARGRFCELAGTAAGLGARHHDLSLLGLFSMIDAIVARPLAPTLEAVCLPADVTAGILGEPGQMADLLNLARAYERAEWGAVETLAERLGLPLSAVPQIYLDAVEWGNRTHSIG
ncbi:MAG: HDOD domain-containing protein [Chloroflexi bacterium]|nr:HDOD domain-containing protein [Chloroflexota bacterium]